MSWIHHCVWVLPALIAIGHRCTLAIRDAIDIGRVDWRQLAVPAGLLLSGLLVLVPDTRAVFNLPFDNLVALTPAQVVLSSLPMLWMLVAMLALPILQGFDARITVPQPGQHLVGVLPEQSAGRECSRCRSDPSASKNRSGGPGSVHRPEVGVLDVDQQAL